VEAANDAQTVLVNTQHAEKITARKIYQNQYYGIAMCITKSLQTSGKPIIQFISSWGQAATSVNVLIRAIFEH